MSKILKKVRWEILLLRIAEVLAADIAASLILGLGFRDMGIHAGIATLGVIRGFFSEWRRAIQPDPPKKQLTLLAVEKSEQVID